MRNLLIKHNSNRSKFDFLSIPAYFTVMLLCISACFWLVIENANQNTNLEIAPCFITIILILISSFLYMISRSYRRENRIFVIIAIPIGLFFLFFILPTDIPDEVWHIYRALTVFKNDGSSMMVPSDADYYFSINPISYSDFYNLITTNTDWESTFRCSKEMNSYLPIQYVLSGTVMQMAKLFGGNYWLAIYAGRVANLILFIFVGNFILKTVPYGKNAFLVFLLNPVLLQQEASISADALCNICAFLYITFLIKAYLEDENRKRNAILMMVFAFVLCRCKVGGYIPLCLLMLVFIFKLKNRRQRIIVILITLLTGLVGYIFIVYIYNGELVPEARQLMRDPKNLAIILMNTADRYGPNLFIQYNGAFLGALDIYVPKNYYLTYFILQIVVLLIPNNYSYTTLKNKEKACLVLVCLIELFAIFMTQVWWSQNRGEFDAIQGVQGRYFIPIVFVLLFCLCRIKNINNSNDKEKHFAFISRQINKVSAVLPLRANMFIKHYGIELLIILTFAYIYSGDILAILHHFGI